MSEDVVVTGPRRTMVTAGLCCAAVAGCGGSSHPARTGARRPASAQAVALRLCAAERAAANAVIGAGVETRVADPDPVNIECVLRGGGIRVDVIAQASPQAWTEYDTTRVHLVQAYGSGSVHEPAELPHSVSGMAGNVSWIPAQSELFATNGTQSSGGSYVTVTVTRRTRHGPASVSVARAIARSTLAAAPHGPSPGPPPS
jgi:hypothetical protein